MQRLTITTPTRRLCVATVTAVGMTGVLFWIMQSAIHNDEIKVSEVLLTPPIDLVRIERDEEIDDSRTNKVDPPEPVEKLPPQPTVELEGGEGVEIADEYSPPVVGPDNLRGVGHSDGDAIPVMTVAPEYPRRQLTQGVEGWVIVEFLIDKLGRVRNAKVVEAQPARIFDRAAIKAVERYKYKPKVLNGEAMSVHGVRQRIVFELS